MLTLRDLFSRLSYGPLSNLALSNEGAGGIIEARQPGMVHYTNEALLRLHSRFVLKEKELILRMADGVSNYEFSPAHTYVQSTATSATYIMDSKTKPFLNDVIKVLKVFDAGGCQMALNDDNDCNSVFTPTPNSLQFPRICPNNLVFVLYQARHIPLSGNPVKLDSFIDLPDVLEEALLSYIAHKVLANMNGQEHAARAAIHLSNYEMVCANVREGDLVNNSISSSNAKFEIRGFR